MEHNYPRILAVTAIVIAPDQRILLHRRTHADQQGMWEIFGTYVRPQERLTAALWRMLQADLGLVHQPRMEFTGNYYDTPERQVGSFCIPFPFRVYPATEDLALLQNLDETCGWFSLPEIREMSMAFDNREQVVDALEGLNGFSA